MADSLLRDINREQAKMQADIGKLNEHYSKLQAFIHEYIKQTTIEWARLAANHPKSLLLIVETTRVYNSEGYSNGETEPIRLLAAASSGEVVFDHLLRPTYSSQITWTEYHGLEMKDLEDKPRFADIALEIADKLINRHIIVFGADYARSALQTVYFTRCLDGAFCLHNRCKEYYGEFYDLSLETVLSYQGIEKKRADLKDSRDRVRMLALVLCNLAAGMKKQIPEGDTPNDEIDDHPF